MTAPAQTPAQPARPRRSLTSVAAFGLGLPLAALALAVIRLGLLKQTPLAALHEYLSHGVEQVEIVLFCCAISALAAKLWQSFGERRALRVEILPEWDGNTSPVSEAPKLFAGIARVPQSLQKTWMVNRIAGVLDFLVARGSAAELDDHLRDLADAEALALENSYALIRFITWAIPILGFLGTVLGITGAIAGVTPERLEHDLSAVTDGLALAFNATALALALTMVTMFLTYLVDRREQGILETVDRYAARNLAHRFERGSSDHGEVVGVVRANAQLMLQSSDELVKRQAELWAKTLDEVNKRHSETAAKQGAQLTAALESALQKTLETHAKRLTVAESQNNKLLEQIAMLTAVVTQQQAGLAKLQDGEGQLLRLQELLARNLDALTAAGAFEEAVHSLTAAVHLLTARASTAPPSKRPGVAA
jgi:biopolymer transport protein ExbB/TolQ